LYEVRDIGLETVKLLEANYPEDLRKTIIINGKYINYLDPWKTTYLFPLFVCSSQTVHCGVCYGETISESCNAREDKRLRF